MGKHLVCGGNHVSFELFNEKGHLFLESYVLIDCLGVGVIEMGNRMYSIVNVVTKYILRYMH